MGRTLLVLAAVAAVIPSVVLLPLASGVPSDEHWGPVAKPSKALWAATRLSDGMVLAAHPGGNNARCEGVCFGLYDPALDRWIDVAPRPLHNFQVRSMVPLRGNKGALVLYRAFGEDQITPKYRYQPEGDEWTYVRPSIYNRKNGFSATLLDGSQAECGDNCGKVLIAGGLNDGKSGPTDVTLNWTAELYDPADDTLTPTGAIPMDGGHPGHRNAAAAQLADGRVLVVGGCCSLSGTNSMASYADLYNPRTGSWSPATPLPPGLEQMPLDRGGAVRLQDGRVLVVGDWHEQPHPPVVFDPTKGELDDATGERKGSWTAIEQCPGAKMCGLPVVLDDSSVMAFGIDPADKGAAFLLEPANLDDPAAPDWTRIENVPLTGANDDAYAAVALSGGTEQCGHNCGKVLALGGYVLPGGNINNSVATVAIYPAANLPTVTAVSPRAGFSCGGQEVTISGTGFAPATAVNFGDVSVPQAEFRVSPAGDTITVKAPPHLPGEVEVTVLAELRSAANPDATYTYKAAPPAAVDGLTPIRGPASGGTSVDIRGSFAAECLQAVKFDDIPAAYTMANSAPGEPTDAIAATSPPHEPGRARVTVEMRHGPSSPSGGPELPTLPTLPPLPTDPPPSDVDVFTYYPVISGLFPPTGPLVGGNQVTIAGKGFANATEARFGTESAPIVRRSDTEVVALAPAHATPEAVVVQVVAAGVVALPDNVLYTYVAPELIDPPGELNDPGAGPPKQNTSPPEAAPPGGSPVPSPAGAPAPANAPGPSPAQIPAPASAPGPAQAPAQGPAPGVAPGQAGAPGQAPSQVSSGAAVPPLVPVAGVAPAPAQATPGSGQAAGSDEDQEQARGSTRHAMVDAQLGLGLAGAAASACFSWMALTGRMPSRRRRPDGALRPSRTY